MPEHVNNRIAGMRMPESTCLNVIPVRMPDRRANYCHQTACLNNILNMPEYGINVHFSSVREALIGMGKVNG